MSSKKKAIAGYAVAGPVGALVGASVPSGKKGYDMSDVPFGVHVEASWEDDDTGRHWTLSFLSELPSSARAEIHLLTDAGERVLGREPCVDADGHFAVEASIADAACVFFMPFDAAAYTSPKHISLEVVVWGAGNNKPSGKAILDASLPPKR